MTGLRALLVLSVTSVGCATTSGHDWLNTPLDQQAELASGSLQTSETGADSRPRLNHTVTLGETYTSEATPAAPAPGPAIQINVQTPVVINHLGGYGYAYGYGAYGYGASSSSNAATRATSTRAASAATKVGADFPAVPDYGPRALK